MISSCYDKDRDVLVCAFQGKQDSGATQAASERFQAAWSSAQAERPGRAGAPSLAFDLSGVDFISSAFLRLCLQAAKLSGGGAFRLVGVSPAVKKLFVVAGLEHLLG